MLHWSFWFIARPFLTLRIQLIAECSAAVTYRCGGRGGSWGLSVCWSLASRFDIWRATIRCEHTCENGDHRALEMTLRRDCICAVFPVDGAKNRVKHRNQLEHNIGICFRTLSCHAVRLGLKKYSGGCSICATLRIENHLPMMIKKYYFGTVTIEPSSMKQFYSVWDYFFHCVSFWFFQAVNHSSWI